MYYNLLITETSRNSLKDEPTSFNSIREKFESIAEVKQYIIDRYGLFPRGKNKVYRDCNNGHSIEVGFLHSFWNQDISHNDKKWFQTDWISITEVHEEPVLLSR